MVYRGFTWNLTSYEAEGLIRVLQLSERCDHCREWDRRIIAHLLAVGRQYREVSTDGKVPPAYLYGDA